MTFERFMQVGSTVLLIVLAGGVLWLYVDAMGWLLGTLAWIFMAVFFYGYSKFVQKLDSDARREIAKKQEDCPHANIHLKCLDCKKDLGVAR